MRDITTVVEVKAMTGSRSNQGAGAVVDDGQGDVRSGRATPGRATPGRARPGTGHTGGGVGRTGVVDRRRPSTLRLLEDDLRDAARPRALWGAAVETLWVSAHLATYPWGVLRDRHEWHDRYHLGGLAPHQRGLVIGDVEAAGTPILLVHGMTDNRAIFSVMRRTLRRRGFGKVFAINYSPMTNDIRAAARDLAGAIEELVARTGYERIHVIGHSLGGLISRYYAQRLGGDERIHTLVTLGTPHGGSLPAYALPVTLGRQLRPGSDFYAELAQPAQCRTRFVAYWSDLDQLVVPHANGRIEHPDLHARNVLVPGVGHMSLPIHSGVAREIAALLSQLDHDGATLAAGLSPITPESVLTAEPVA